MLSRETTGIVLLLLSLPGAEASVAQQPATRGFSIVGRSETTQESVEVRLYRKMVAVVIGIDRYEDPLLNLSYAVKDAEGMEQVLRNQYVFDPVHTLLNEQATRGNILALLQTRLRNETTSDDAVLVFFSGHGDTVETSTGPIGYLVPHDGVIGQPERNISMSMLRDDVSRLIPARHILFIVDACYGGLLTTKSGVADRPRSMEYLQSIAEKRSRQVLTAGMADQEVLDGGPLGYAVFTGRVVQTLQDATDYLTAYQLAMTVKEQVFRDAEARQHEQTPTFGRLSGEGEFVFVPRRESLAEINAERARLQAELAALRRAEADDAAVERKKNLQQQAEIEEQIRRGREASRLEKERLIREQEVQERVRQEAERRRQEERERMQAAQDRERLRRQFEEEKARQETVRQGMTLTEAIAQAASLRMELSDVESQIRAEVEAEKKLIAAPRIYRIAPQGEFETQQAYETRRRRIAQDNDAEQERYTRETAVLDAASPTRIEDAQQGSQAVLNALVEREFPIGPENMDLTIGEYDIGREEFPAKVTVTSIPTLSQTDVFLSVPVGLASALRDAEQDGILRFSAMGQVTSDGAVTLSGLRLDGPTLPELDDSMFIEVPVERTVGSHSYYGSIMDLGIEHISSRGYDGPTSQAALYMAGVVVGGPVLGPLRAHGALIEGLSVSTAQGDTL